MVGRDLKNKGEYPKLLKKVKDDFMTFDVKLTAFSKEPTKFHFTTDYGLIILQVCEIYKVTFFFANLKKKNPRFVVYCPVGH